MDRVVFASGSFDVLHVGHIHFLERAKALGDKLLVGAQKDEWIQDVKGHDPLMSLYERLRIVNALKVVDWVIPVYGPEGPEELSGWNVTIRAIGEDHDKVWEKAQEIEDSFEAAGIHYVHLLRTPGISSATFRDKVDKPYDFFIVSSSSLELTAKSMARILEIQGYSTFCPNWDIPDSFSLAKHKQQVIDAAHKSKKVRMIWDGVSHGPLVDLGICLGAGVEVDGVRIITASKADTYIKELEERWL